MSACLHAAARRGARPAGVLLLVLALMPALALAAPRVIVKFKEPSTKAYFTPRSQVARVADDLGVGVRYDRAMALGMSLVAAADASSAEALAAQLSQHPEVEWAQPDLRRQPRLLANDEFVNGQTYLDNTGAGIHAFAAWDLTTGSSATVVAVVDTGYRPHQDLAGRLLPGYDFVSDVARANDGDGRDPDATDPGDWVSAADHALPAFSACQQRSSSWHGTAVAGIIAANTNNGLWVAGIDWQAKILPVRVLGKCGGDDSDIIDGVAWAAGLPVPGAPPNLTPAHVINMSFGGNGPCLPAYDAVFKAALGAGHTRALVAAAGNDADDVANHAPADCPEPIAVASTNVRGSLATYSNSGAGITIAAPGGQYLGYLGSGGIIVLSDTGTTTPGTDSYRVEGGTSFAAPMISGSVALMLAANPGLTASDVRSILLSTAQPFPAGSTCNTATCGAGIVNARAAVDAAQALLPAATTVTVVEYYNAALDHYFITWQPAEIAALDAGITLKGWQRTGATFKAYPSARPGTSPVCRYYMPPAFGDSHFFGRGAAECQSTGIRNPGFQLESSEFMDVFLPVAGACAADTVPVYRVFDNRPGDANHRYTTDRSIRDAMIAQGWVAEGDGPDLVVMCAPM